MYLTNISTSESEQPMQHQFSPRTCANCSLRHSESGQSKDKDGHLIARCPDVGCRQCPEASQKAEGCQESRLVSRPHGTVAKIPRSSTSRPTNQQQPSTTPTMTRPTVTVISAKGESTKDTVPVPNVFKVSRQCLSQRQPQSDRKARTNMLEGHRFHANTRE